MLRAVRTPPVALCARRSASSGAPPPVDLLAQLRPGQDLVQAYYGMVKAGRLLQDPYQVKGARQLQDLQARLRGYALPPPPPPPAEAAPAAAQGGGGWFGRLLGSRKGDAEAEAKAAEAAATAAAAVADAATAKTPKGLYLWGGPGCGKTMLMDLFYHTSPHPKKKRVHYHSFVLDLHRRNHELRQQTKDPLNGLAESILQECTVLCLDELQVVDVADAMLIRRLFDILFQRGLVLVTTSNRKPDDLYFNGLQRLSFVPFIEQVNRRLDVMCLSETDYRLETTAARTFITPLGPEATQAVTAMFAQLTRGEMCLPMRLEIKGQGRHVDVPKGCPQNGVAWFTFNELCARNVAAADYFTIAEAFTTLFITDIPRLTQFDLNEVRRLITLLDVLYECKVRTIITAQLSPEELFSMRDVPGDVSFACERAISRLTEMQSREYLLSTRTAHFRLQPPAEFLRPLYGRQLSMPEAEALWNRYDLDLSGYLDADELRLLAGDLRQCAGTGNPGLPVPAASVAALVRNAHGKTKDRLTRGEFIAYVTKNALVAP